MVGKSLKEILPNAIYLSSSDYDLTKSDHIDKMLIDLSPNTVIHLAAKVGGIIDNIKKPAEYFTNNILMNTLLVDKCHKNGVERFIGMLSTCIYPDLLSEEFYPMEESVMHIGPPTPTNFHYGYAKRCLAVQIDAYNKQYGRKYSYIIPSNIYGEHDKFNPNESHYVAALLVKIKNSILEKKNTITLFGTGKPLRQFIYSKDVAKIIKQCIEKDITDSFNITSDETYSIDEIAKIATKSCGAEYLKIEYDNSKPDGQFKKTSSNKKFKTLFPNFKFTKLESGIKETWDKIKNNNNLLL